MLTMEPAWLLSQAGSIIRVMTIINLPSVCPSTIVIPNMSHANQYGDNNGVKNGLEEQLIAVQYSSADRSQYIVEMRSSQCYFSFCFQLHFSVSDFSVTVTVTVIPLHNTDTDM